MSQNRRGWGRLVAQSCISHLSQGDADQTVHVSGSMSGCGLWRSDGTDTDGSQGWPGTGCHGRLTSARSWSRQSADAAGLPAFAVRLISACARAVRGLGAGQRVDGSSSAASAPGRMSPAVPARACGSRGAAARSRCMSSGLSADLGAGMPGSPRDGGSGHDGWNAFGSAGASAARACCLAATS